jgi:hypothetical protein
VVRAAVTDAAATSPTSARCIAPGREDLVEFVMEVPFIRR